MADIFGRCQQKHKKDIIMDAASQSKTEKINLRVKSSAKDLIMLAAGFEGKTVSHFILTSALKCTKKTVQEHQMMTLNAKESKAFLEALSAPVRFNWQACSQQKCPGVCKWNNQIKQYLPVRSESNPGVIYRLIPILFQCKEFSGEVDSMFPYIERKDSVAGQTSFEPEWSGC